MLGTWLTGLGAELGLGTGLGTRLDTGLGLGMQLE